MINLKDRLIILRAYYVNNQDYCINLTDFDINKEEELLNDVGNSFVEHSELNEFLKRIKDEWTKRV